MSVSFKKLWNEYGVGGLLIAIIVLYGVYMLYKNLMSKGKSGNEYLTQNRKQAYNNNSNSSAPSGPQPAQESGNEVYSSVNGSQGSSMTPPSSCGGNQNPADLLPKDTNCLLYTSPSPRD